MRCARRPVAAAGCKSGMLRTLGVVQNRLTATYMRPRVASQGNKFSSWASGRGPGRPLAPGSVSATTVLMAAELTVVAEAAVVRPTSSPRQPFRASDHSPVTSDPAAPGKPTGHRLSPLHLHLEQLPE